MFSVNITMSLLTLSMLPVILYMGYYFYAKQTPRQVAINDKWDDIYGRIGDAVNNFLSVKSINLFSGLKNNLIKKSEKIEKIQLKVSKMWAVSDLYISVMVMISRLLVL